MRQKVSKKLRKLVTSQFKGQVNPRVINQVYNRTKIAWNKTPRGQRASFMKWMETANNLQKSVTGTK